MKDTGVEPFSVQWVSIQLTRTVPVGVTVHDCIADAPPLPVAVTVKLFETRDCAEVGVQETVLPLSVAPVGAAVSAKLTEPPAESLAAS